MDAVFPPDVPGFEPSLKGQLGVLDQGLSLRCAHGVWPVIELTSAGFVIPADKPPPIGGYTDIYRGDNWILHGLATCIWAGDGRVGYEFKHVRRIGPA